MLRVTIRLCLAVFWITIAYLIYFKGKFAPNAWGDERLVALAAVLALAIGIGQIVRAVIFAMPRPPAADPIPMDDPPADRPEEYHPEFDFTKQGP